MTLSDAAIAAIEEDKILMEIYFAPWIRAKAILDEIKEGIDVPGVQAWYASTNELQVAGAVGGSDAVQVSLWADFEEGRITVQRGTYAKPDRRYGVLTAWSADDAMKGVARLFRQGDPDLGRIFTKMLGA